MSNPINTLPIQLFIQQVKAAELSQQREIKLDIKTAKNLAFCLAELNAKIVQDLDLIISKIQTNTGQNISVSMDGGGFGKN